MADVKKLRELLAKATPGPWVVAQDEDGRIEPHIMAGEWFVATVIDGADRRPPDDNAALIAAMHEAMPELLAIAEASESLRADAIAIVRSDASGTCRVELLSPYPIPPSTVCKLYARVVA